MITAEPYGVADRVIWKIGRQLFSLGNGIRQGASKSLHLSVFHGTYEII
jgi:hypothetical protein